VKTGDLKGVYLRCLALQASWNDERMQNLGLLAALAPWLRRRDPDLADRRRFCRRHLGVFNTNPYLASLVVGGLIRLEGDPAVTPATKVAFRDTLARVCGSLGDQLFWLGLRPVVALAAILLGLAGQWAAVLAAVGVFAVGQLWLRRRWLEAGYALGRDVVDLLARRVWYRAIVVAKRLALALTGLLAGVYIAGNPDREHAIGVVIGLVLPLVLRQRIPGEAQALVGLALAIGVALVW
jgi:mannose/fructose/N-acetylgalactosamine-specific phosphotransferase system component IID